MRKDGDYSRDLAGFAIRVLRAVWLWAERLTWVKVHTALSLVLVVTMVILVGCIYDQNRRIAHLQEGTELLAMGTYTLIQATKEQNEILQGYADRYHPKGTCVVAGTELPPLYGE